MINILNHILNKNNGKELLSSLISIINIITTITLAIVNIFILHRQTKKMDRNEALLSYYYPIKLALSSLEQKMTLIDDKNYDIIDYKNCPKNLRKDVLNHYKTYINVIDSITPKRIIYKLDKEIIKLNNCFKMLILYENQENYDIKDFRDKYSHKSINEIIIMIDKYLEKI